MSGVRRVAVTGTGVVSPLGDCAAELFAALCAGRSGSGPVELFELDGMRCREAFEVKGFDARRYLGNGNLRPLDRSGQLAACAARLALAESGWTADDLGRQEVGLVLGTMFGSVHTISEFDRRALTDGPIYARPLDFANSVINASAGQTAIWHGLRGVNSTVSGGTVSGLQALACAAELIRSGQSDAVLAGGGDELCFESFYGFYRAGLVAGSRNGGKPVAVPFDARRNGFLPGEGAALLMLEEAAAARRRGATILAEISGWGSSFDPSQGRDERRTADAAARAIGVALDVAGCRPEAIDAVSASANGSVASDRGEGRGIAAAFERCPPVTAVKSMLGEAQGASGALQTLALLQAMAAGVLPGVPGLERIEDGLPPAMVRAESRELVIRRGLVTGVGLDGNACAVVVERPAEGG